MISYVVLSTKVRSILPGTPTIPDQIVTSRTSYFEAPEAASSAWATSNTIDVTKMQDLIGRLLAPQLVNAHQAASHQ